MALKLHGGASLAVLALTQFNFCSRGHRKYVSITLSSPGGLQAPCPRAITAVIDMSCRVGKKIDGITKVKNLTWMSRTCLLQSVVRQQSTDSESVSKMCFTFDGDVRSGMFNCCTTLLFIYSFYLFTTAISRCNERNMPQRRYYYSLDHNDKT